MSLSLRDQLLQAGLITKKQAQDASRQKHNQRKDKDKGTNKAPAEPDLGEAYAMRAAAEKKARDQELARAEREKREAKARRAEIKQLVAEHKLPKVESDELYNFVDGSKIRRIPVNADMRTRLVAAKLAIVRNDGRYEVVPIEVGRKIGERDRNFLVHVAEPEKKPGDDGDDPYKDYVVPDDLMW